MGNTHIADSGRCSDSHTADAIVVDGKMRLRNICYNITGKCTDSDKRGGL